MLPESAKPDPGKPLKTRLRSGSLRLHRRRLEEEPRGGAEIAERDVFGFDPENLLPLPASATSASPRCNLESIFKITFVCHSSGLPGRLRPTLLRNRPETRWGDAGPARRIRAHSHTSTRRVRSPALPG